LTHCYTAHMEVTASQSLRPTYFIVNSRGDGSIREWQPPYWDASLPPDCRYYGRVFEEMERHLQIQGLHFYITWDIDRLPEYGPHVVVLLLGDEFGQVPRYARYVNTVLKVLCGTVPFLGIRRWVPFDSLRWTLLVRYLRDLALHVRSLIRERFSQSEFPGSPILPCPHILNTPGGYFNLDELPMKLMKDRPFHSFFAGTIRSKPRKGLRRLTSSPKDLARAAMFKESVALAERNPRFKLDYNVIHKFGEGTISQPDPRSYSQRMMDSKICLAPRGNVVDTWRFFEGLKSGCLVVCEPLPDQYYYRDAPVIQIDYWNQLEQAIAPFLEDEAALQEWSDRTIQFWNEVCGEQAIGRRVAEFIHQSPASDRLRSSSMLQSQHAHP
jgi:hypothetical protein